MSTANIFLIFVQLFMLTSAATNYCTLCDRPGSHTLCLYPSPGPGPACSPDSENPLSQSEMDEIVSMHNKFRNKVALGETKLPTAADMNELLWDEELMNISQRWMDQCKFEHDECRNSKRFPVGQNLGRSIAIDPEVDHIEIIVKDWMKEIELFNATQTQKFQRNDKTSNFTQMIWARTYLIGCGRVRYKVGNNTGDMVACNYGPAGNVLDQRVYIKGKPCRLCPRETKCHWDLTGLCSRSSRPLCYLRLRIILQIYIMVTLNTIM